MRSLIAFSSWSAMLVLISCGNSSSEGGDRNIDTAAVAADAGTINNTNNTLAQDDREFLMDAAKGGMKEIAASEAAQKKATTTQAKEVAEMMVKDHTAMHEQVKALALKKNLTLPTSLDDDAMEDMNKLNELSGAGFDKAYLDQMVKDHKQTIENFEKASKDAKDTAVKALATAALPKLRHHLEMVQNTQSKTGNNKNGQ